MDYGNIIKLSQGFENPNDLSTEQSLINTLLQKPDFADTLYQAYPYYSLMSTSGIAFNDLSIQFTGDRQFRYSVLPRSDNPLTYLSTISGTGVGNSVFTIQCLEGYGQMNSVFRTENGQSLQIVAPSVQTGGAFNYDVKIYGNDKTATFTTPAAMTKLGHMVGVYGEGSYRAFNTIMYPDWLTNYTTITRDEYKITGSAATSITWLTMGDAKFWIPGSPQDFQNFFSGDGGYLYKKEKAFWGLPTTVDATGISQYTDAQGNPIYGGNGFMAQIANSQTSPYTVAGFNESWIHDALAKFVYTAGVGEAIIDVHTGSGGYSLFQKAMKLYGNNRTRYTLPGGTEIRTIAYGEKIYKFYINDATITVYKNPILSDPNFFTKLDPSGFPAESFNFYLCENTADSNIPTLQRIAKNNRSMELWEQAKTGFDGRIFEALSEDMVVVRKPNRVGKWVKAG